jgi:2-keto-4-pentenoate hydratase/2-oxohepta-3-ene-1,7-dioic acid hydratase in catechol pathway
MRLGTVALEGGRRAVVAGGADGRVHDVTAQLGDDLAAALGDGRAAGLRDPGDGAKLQRGAFRWLPPIPSPRRILLAGFNFRSHASESAREVPSHPTFFVRFPSSFVGHEQPIERPAESETLDWEGEIALVIGRGGRRMREATALEHVAGYAPLGDNSVREFQLHGTQATAGKNFDRTGSWGPWIVTADEIGDPAGLALRTTLNGEEVQAAGLADLVFPVPTLVAYLSSFTTLEPGDVVALGTPQGIGFRREPPVYLCAGDRLTVEMVGHVTLINDVVDEPETA